MKYRDEQDKCYGVAGMALGFSVYDAEHLFTAVTIDADVDETIRFTPEFFFVGNPRLSARDSWQYMLSHFKVTMGLAIANALCRRMVLDKGSADDTLRQQLLNAACEDGMDYCQLERDEVQPIFDKAFDYLSRLFSADPVHHAMHTVATTLQQRRTLTKTEVAELLQRLNIK